MSSKGRSRLLVTSRDVQNVRMLLESRYERVDDHEDNDAADIVIKHGLRFSDALEFMQVRRPVVSAYYDDTLFAIETTRMDHSMVASYVVSLIHRQMPDFENIRCGSGMSIPLGRRVRQPDESVSPHPRLPARQYPSVVVEVAALQSLRSLYRSATDYLQHCTDVQLVLAFKMYRRQMHGNSPSRKLLFLLFQRSPNPMLRNGYIVPDIVLSFGNISLSRSIVLALERFGVPQGRTGGYLSVGGSQMCSALGQAPYVITLPYSHVCFDATFPIPPGVLNGFLLDLHKVQGVALEYDS